MGLYGLFSLVRDYIALNYYCLIHIIKYLWKRGNSTYDDCINDIINYKRLNIRYHSESKELSDKPCLYLCNHRAISDAFIDSFLAKGSAAIGLYKFAYVCPTPFTLAMLTGSFIPFSLKYSSRDKLYESVKNKLKTRSVLLYPEGSRNIKQKSLELKTGFIKFAYKNNIPIQIIIANNKEHAMSFKLLKADFDVEILAYNSKVLYPKDYDTEEKWIDGVQQLWDLSWNKIY